MTDEHIRTHVAPISKYQPFGCMTIPILAVAGMVAAWLFFAGAVKRWISWMIGY